MYFEGCKIFQTYQIWIALRGSYLKFLIVDSRVPVLFFCTVPEMATKREKISNFVAYIKSEVIYLKLKINTNIQLNKWVAYESIRFSVPSMRTILSNLLMDCSFNAHYFWGFKNTTISQKFSQFFFKISRNITLKILKE